MRRPCETVVITALLAALAACASTTLESPDKDGGGTDADTDTDSDSDSDTDSDSDSDSDADPCPHGCLSESVCDASGGTIHEEYVCTTEGTVCCEIASPDADTDADADADADTDADTDTDPGPTCTGDLQCVSQYPNIACCNNTCVNPLNNASHCGVCGNDCVATQVGNQCSLGECRCGMLSGACDPPNDCCVSVLGMWVCDVCY